MDVRMIVLSCSLLFCLSCQNTEQKTLPPASATSRWKPPVAGTTIAAYEKRIAEDKLNKLYFRVSVTSTPQSLQGIYNIQLEYGYNINKTQITLPEWVNHAVLRPRIKAGSAAYQCFIGFDAGDGIFHELYEVTAVNGTIRMKKTKDYVINH